MDFYQCFKDQRREFSVTTSEEDIYFFFRILFGRIPSEEEWRCHKTFAKKIYTISLSFMLNPRSFRNDFRM